MAERLNLVHNVQLLIEHQCWLRVYCDKLTHSLSSLRTGLSSTFNKKWGGFSEYGREIDCDLTILNRQTVDLTVREVFTLFL